MQTEDYEYLYALEESFWWFPGMREITAALLDPFCPQGRDRLILDAGCGTGINLEWLRRYASGGRVCGIDVSCDALRFCRAREQQQAYLARASVAALPFADARFDLVTSFDVMVQLPGTGADAQAAREMYRVLRPSGIAFVRGAAYEWMHSGHDDALRTQRRYSLGVLKGLLEAAGFHVLRATYANSVLLPAAALRRLVLKRIGLADNGSDVKPLSPGLHWLNSALQTMLNSEASLLSATQLNLPAGLSAICIAQKPDS